MSLRVVVHESIINKTNVELRLTELETLDESRPAAQSNTFNKCVWLHSFLEDYLVLIVRLPLIIDKKKENIERKWEGSFMVKKVFSNEGISLDDYRGERIICATNACFL